MDVLIDITKILSFIIIGIILLAILVFGFIKLGIGIGSFLNVESLHQSFLDMEDKSKNALIQMFNKSKKFILPLTFLFAIIIIIGNIESVMDPLRFEKEKDRRYQATKKRLMDIRLAQEAYKSEHGKYTGNFDTLITFLKKDSFSIVKKIGTIPEELIDSLKSIEKAEKIALEEGLIKRDTAKVSVLDSLFKKRKYVVDSLKFVPFTDNKTFQMAAKPLETNAQVTVQVFEVKVPFDSLLYDLDRQLVINFNEERMKKTGYAGLKVGSLTEATNNVGNWE